MGEVSKLMFSDDFSSSSLMTAAGDVRGPEFSKQEPNGPQNGTPKSIILGGKNETLFWRGCTLHGGLVSAHSAPDCLAPIN